MGVDISMYIVKDKKDISNTSSSWGIFDGRNSIWFNNLQQIGDNEIYNYLNIKPGISKQAPDDFSKYKNLDYYGFNYISVKDFKDWFIKYRPDIDAGWISTYDKWRMEKKGYEPDYLPKYLDKDDDINDMHFVEYETIWDDCSIWLYNYLIDNKVPDEADITYWFDC